MKGFPTRAVGPKNDIANPPVSERFRNVLARNLLFRGLPASIIDRLASVAMRRTYTKGERVFSQGDEGDSLLGVISGRIRIGAVGATGKEVFLNIMEPGDSFGEIAVVDGLPRTAGATAMEPTVLIAVGRREFLEVLREEPELAIHLLGLFCERIRWASDLYEDSAFLAAPARLAKKLLSLAMLHGKRTDEGVELAISQSELARFLGISRQIVNQNLQEWKAKGWLSVARARLLIIDASSLKNVAAGDVSEEIEQTPPGR